MREVCCIKPSAFFETGLPISVKKNPTASPAATIPPASFQEICDPKERVRGILRGDCAPGSASAGTKGTGPDSENIVCLSISSNLGNIESTKLNAGITLGSLVSSSESTCNRSNIGAQSAHDSR
ncbi:hypothetical protein D3C73_732740 [compost metagenome]